MYTACECLNVILETSVHSPFYTLAENDIYFSMELCSVASSNVREQLPEFVLTRKVGQWIIWHCAFCACDVYAANDNITKANDTLVVPKHRLISDDQLTSKKKSPNYSPFFNMIINHADTNLGNINESKFKTKLPNDVMLWLEEQSNMTKERIQSYSDNEIAALETLERRVRQDCEVVFRKCKNNHQKESDKIPVKKTTTDRRELDLSSLKIEITPISDNTNVKKIESPSYEIDELSFLDDVDIKENLPDDIITEEAEEVIDSDDLAPMRNSPESPISRSLPVPVPYFMKDRRSKDKNVTPEGPCDIAASIEALTRSLHGDNIFGELPPPRLSTTNL